MTLLDIQNKVCDALLALGYHGGKLELNRAGYDEVFVELDGARIGRFDLQKNTFVG